MLYERSVQGWRRVKHKTYSPFDDHWVILSSSKAFDYSPSRHISVLIRSGILTVFALNWKKNKHLSSTSHADTSMTYCQSITQILGIIWVRLSRWAWDQRHDGEQHPCFQLRCTPVDREWRSAAHFPLRQTWRFQLPYHKLSIPK